MPANWTEPQKRAIYTHDRNLLVSAAAGSGKTAVLAERCAYLVCDAPEPCDVDELLVVTFTNAAAEEMRRRIGQAIARRAAERDDPRLHRQAILINAAQISTIHALGSAILRRHFHELGLDPNFRLLNEEEAKLLRADLVNELLENKFDDPAQKEFRELVDRYGAGNPSTVADLVLSLHARLSSMVDRPRWLADRRARLVEAIEKPLSDSDIGKRVMAVLLERIETLASSAHRLAQTLDRTGSVCDYAPHVRVIEAMLRDWATFLATRPWDEIAPNIAEFQFDRAPSVKACPEKEGAKGRVDALKERIKSFVEGGLFSFSEAALRDGLRQTLWVTDQCAALVEAFESRYAAAKAELGALDFGDLEALTLRLLREPASEPPAPSKIARDYQKQYRHVLVDEYQDVNELQDTMLALLSRETNLFTVGDVKQSIYRFRQADPGRFIGRYKRYALEKPAPGEIVLLNQNFRSRGPLLDVLNNVFAALMTKESAEVAYNDSQMLKQGATYPNEPGLFTGRPIELHVIDRNAERDIDAEYDAEEREAVLTAERIHALLGRDGKPPARVSQRDGTTRNIEPRDIVILLRAMHIKAERFAGILRRAGIPVQADSTNGFFASTEIRDLLSALKLIDNTRDDIALASFLRSPLSGWRDVPDKLAEIRLAYPPSAQTPCFHQSFARYADERKDALSKLVKAVQAQLEAWRALGQNKTVADVIAAVLQDTSYLAYISGLPDGEQRIANVLHLHDRARQFETFGRPTVGRFLHFLENLQEEGDLGMPAVAGVSQNAVRIMSVHKSKGLEFPVVILPDLGKAHNLRDATVKLMMDDSVGIAARVVDPDKEIHYASLATTLAGWEYRRKQLAEELRVLYVAGTRAKEHLILIGSAGESCLQEWDDAWAGHVGPMPPGDVLAGCSMLDWIGPASAIAESRSPGSFQRATYTTEELNARAKAVLSGRSRSEAAADLADLKPLKPPAPRSGAVEAAIARLNFAYPNDKLTGIPAAATVTGITKTGRVVLAGSAEAPKFAINFDRLLRMPRVVAGEAKLAPTDVGSITHTVLQRIDLSSACDRADLLKQMQAMAERRFIRAVDIPFVDVDAILWLLSHPLAEKLRRNQATLLREFDITFAAPSEAAVGEDIADSVMVRGRIDAIVVEPDGLTLIDYKTDRLTPELVPQRVASYRPQIDAYREHLERLTKRKVKDAYLAFLTPKVVERV